MSEATWQFVMRTRVVVGPGCLQQAGTELAAAGAQKVLLVTGMRVRRTGAAERAKTALTRTNLQVELFDETVSEPTVESIQNGVAAAKNFGADWIMALGGGSVLDSAKAIAVGATNDGPVTAWEGGDAFANDPLPVAAAPTTAGTASEVTFFSVVTDPQSKRKVIINSERIAPRIAFLDPTLLRSAPREVKVAAGMDALTQAIEAYIARSATIPSDACSFTAARLIAQNLEDSLEADAPLEVLEKVQIGACLTGWAFNNTRLGVVHAMALPVGAHFGAPHGAVNAVLLPHGMQFNISQAQRKLAALAGAIGVKRRGMSEAESAKAAVSAVRELGRRIGAPATLSALGVEAEAIPAMAADAMKSAHIAVNPRPIQASDLEALYRAAM